MIFWKSALGRLVFKYSGIAYRIGSAKKRKLYMIKLKHCVWLKILKLTSSDTIQAFLKNVLAQHFLRLR